MLRPNDGKRVAVSAVLLAMSQPARAARLGEYLRLAGVEVRHAASGEQALRQLERWRPDAVIGHAQLEDMSGLELLWAVRGEAQLWEVVVLLLGVPESAAFGIRDAALPGEVTPNEILRELLPIFDGAPGAAVARLEGSLVNLGLDGVLSALNQGRRSGALRVSTLGSRAELWLAQGQVINARQGRLGGESALLNILAGTRVLLNAEYLFEQGDVADVPRLIAAPTQTFLGKA